MQSACTTAAVSRVSRAAHAARLARGPPALCMRSDVHCITEEQSEQQHEPHRCHMNPHTTPRREQQEPSPSSKTLACSLHTIQRLSWTDLGGHSLAIAKSFIGHCVVPRGSL